MKSPPGGFSSVRRDGLQQDPAGDLPVRGAFFGVHRDDIMHRAKTCAESEGREQ